MLRIRVLSSENDDIYSNSGLDHAKMCDYFTAPLRSFLLQRIAFGSFPEVVLSADPRRLLRDLSADYLYFDDQHLGERI